MLRISLAILGVVSAVSAADRFVYPLPPDSALSVQRDVTYKTLPSGALHFDLYRPAKHSADALPVVVFMNGVGAGDFKSWTQYTGWARLVTTIGMAGVVFDSHEAPAGEDASDLLTYLRQHAAELHIDAASVILWACSSNVGAGLPLAMDPRQTAIKAAVIYYGVGVVEVLRPELPILMVRAGLDGAGLNRGIDRFVTRATGENAPLTLLNLPAAHHGFDVRDDNEASRAAILRTLDFMKSAIEPALQRAITEGVSEASAAAAVYRGDSAAAVKAYEVLAVGRPQDAEVHRNFGNALYGVGQFKRAIGEYERALELGNPNRGWISYSTASAYMKLGEQDTALNWIEKLKDIPPMRRQLRSDPDFAPLKDNPRFRAIADIK